MEATPAAVAATAPIASVASQAAAKATDIAAEVVDANGSIAESLNAIQIVLFLAVVSACAAIYIRMNRVPTVDEQKYSKIIA